MTAKEMTTVIARERLIATIIEKAAAAAAAAAAAVTVAVAVTTGDLLLTHNRLISCLVSSLESSLKIARIV